MGSAFHSSDIYMGRPFWSNDDREEHFLIEVPGAWVPECDIVYYGLLKSDQSEKFFKLRETTRFNPYQIYNDHMYFNAEDLIRYLYSPDLSLASLEPSFIRDTFITALNMYDYSIANETMIRHALIESALFDKVKSVSLVYPWGTRRIDSDFISRILPSEVRSKIRFFNGSLMEAIQDKPKDIDFFTTIVLNSMEDLNTCIDKRIELSTANSTFLLRNHSGNTSHTIVDDPKNPGQKQAVFQEIGTKEINEKLMTANGIPLTGIRWARFEPMLYQDRKPNIEDFQVGL